MYSESLSAYYYPSSPDQGYVTPQSLHNMTNTDRRRNSEIPNKAKLQESNLHTACLLMPGKKHQISQDIIPTPSSVMDGSYHAALKTHNDSLDILTIVPRAPEHCGLPSLPSIVFSIKGTPGPYLNDVGRVLLDGSSDPVFEGHCWKRTGLLIDWPGFRSEKFSLPCTRDSGFYTRQEVAEEVARRLIALILRGHKPNHPDRDTYTRRWDVRTIDPRDVRLVGLNYYQKIWVPVLAVDDL